MNDAEGTKVKCEVVVDVAQIRKAVDSVYRVNVGDDAYLEIREDDDAVGLIQIQAHVGKHSDVPFLLNPDHFDAFVFALFSCRADLLEKYPSKKG